MHTSTSFTLRGGDAAFANRQRLLFDHLSIAESKCNKQDKCETDDKMDTSICEKRPASIDDRKQKRETKKFRGKESIFKRPEGPAPRAHFRNIPDYHKNPHKWVKYSLDDVSNEDMTEHSNTQAALSFLKELKARKKKEETDRKIEILSFDSNAQDSTETRFNSNKCTSSSHITFKKPKETENTDVIEELEERPIFRSSKIILPEYVIGQKPKRTPRQNRPVVKVDRSKELKLDHLEELDEEEDD